MAILSATARYFSHFARQSHGLQRESQQLQQSSYAIALKQKINRLSCHWHALYATLSPEKYQIGDFTGCAVRCSHA